MTALLDLAARLLARLATGGRRAAEELFARGLEGVSRLEPDRRRQVVGDAKEMLETLAKRAELIRVWIDRLASVES